MQVQLRRREFGFWRGWDSLGAGLQAIARRELCLLFLFCACPMSELFQVCTSARAAIRAGADPASVTIITPHPTLPWLEVLAARSLGPVGFEIRSEPAGRPVGRWTVDGALRAICPDLHSSPGDGEEISTCGARADRPVVDTERMGRWCLAAHRRCPHRTFDAGARIRAESRSHV